MKFRISLLSVTLLVGLASAKQVILDSQPLTHALAGNADSSSPWTVFNKTIKRVAVIGAGPSGLQVAAELKDHDFDVRLFDRAPGPGGNWRYSDDIPVRESYPDPPLGQTQWVPDELPHVEYYTEDQDGVTLDERWREHWDPRPIWYNLHTNSPTSITDLPGVPFPPGSPWAPSQQTISAHVRGYASLHGLNADDDPTVVSYVTRVERLIKSPDGTTWTLTLKRLQRLEETNRIKATWWTEEFDAVVVSLGLSSDGTHVPDIPGIVDWSKVRDVDDPSRYSIYHSRGYRRPERYANKTILVVGPSVSGSEISRDIAPYVEKLYVSSKEYDWKKLHPFQRRSFRRFPSTAEFVPEIKSFQPLETLDQGIKSGKIELVNGTVLEGIDEIILATGYQRTNHFLSQVLNDTRKTDGHRPLRHVHWTGHYIPDPTLAFTNCRPWSIVRYQAYGLAKVWEGTARLPSEEELWRQYNTQRWTSFWYFWGTHQSEALLRQWVTWLNNESLKYGGRLVDQFPLERREEFSYYMTLDVEEPYITLENFTSFEKIPASEWGKEQSLWANAEEEDEEGWDYSAMEYGLW